MFEQIGSGRILEHLHHPGLGRHRLADLTQRCDPRLLLGVAELIRTRLLRLVPRGVRRVEDRRGHHRDIWIQPSGEGLEECEIAEGPTPLRHRGHLQQAVRRVDLGTLDGDDRRAVGLTEDVEHRPWGQPDVGHRDELHRAEHDQPADQREDDHLLAGRIEPVPHRSPRRTRCSARRSLSRTVRRAGRCRHQTRATITTAGSHHSSTDMGSGYASVPPRA